MKPFEEQLYLSISINKLIIIGLYFVLLKKKECFFKDLVEKCFQLFPKTFRFDGHPEWPDTKKLDRPLRALRRQGLLTGGSKTKLSLTPRGKRLAINLSKAFTQKKLL